MLMILPLWRATRIIAVFFLTWFAASVKTTSLPSRTVPLSASVAPYCSESLILDELGASLRLGGKADVRKFPVTPLERVPFFDDFAVDCEIY